MPQAYLGIAFGFSIPMAFVAVQGSVPLHAWLVFAANVFWTVAYDTEYALVDKPDDLKLNIKTAAITLGRYDVVGIVVCYAVSLSIWAWVATSLAFWLGWVCAVGIAAYHYMLIRNRDRALCFKAFLHNNWLGAALFAGLVLQYL
jgi:4-hydroxybenzoate polyprenyltransferase